MKLRILYIEDDEVDSIALKRALSMAGVAHELTISRDGEAAIELLQETAPPFIVLLDIGLPRTSGLEVLARIRVDPELCDLPVWILTTSDDPRDIEAASKLDADGYFSKGSASKDPTLFAKQLQLIWDAYTGGS